MKDYKSIRNYFTLSHKDDIRPAELLYIFAGYLTSRKKVITCSGSHHPEDVLDALTAFIEINEFEGIRDDFHKKNLKFPRD